MKFPHASPKRFGLKKSNDKDNTVWCVTEYYSNLEGLLLTEIHTVFLERQPDKNRLQFILYMRDLVCVHDQQHGIIRVVTSLRGYSQTGPSSLRFWTWGWRGPTGSPVEGTRQEVGSGA